MDPYQILGVSPDATDDEVKQAYRKLSKKYHPDANINSVHQEEYTEKFKQVQNAYKTIMDNRKNGFNNQNYTNSQSYQQSYQQSYYQYSGNDQSAFNDAAAFINARRYQDAMNVLEQIRNRNGMWFYYAAMAQNGMGNNATAVEYAQTAVQMEPNNFQYIMLLQQLQQGSSQYRRTQRTYSSPYGNMMNCCYTYLLMQLICGCCCR
ncbi:MAG: J domain-containing protein [Erysipelotrichaceae bacterium]|nr:J domain-containing protein [Erysipelotrichaceae bacterium]